MPFQLFVQPKMGDYTAAAGASIANSLADWKKKQDQQDTEMAYNDEVVQHAIQTGRITPDEYTKYQAGSLTQKRGIAAGIAANIADDYRRGQQSFSKGMQQANLGISQGHLALAQQAAAQQQAAQNWQPPQAAIDAMNATGGALVQVGPGRYVTRDYPDNPNDPNSSGVSVLPLIDPVTKQPVVGRGIVSKTGAVVDTTSGSPTVQLDPTKKFYLDDKTRSWKPLNPKLARSMSDMAGDPNAAPADSNLNFWQRQGARLLGIDPSTINSVTAGTPAAPAAGSQMATAPAAAGAPSYPVGTRARKGDKWFTMTASGWQPE